MYDWINTVLIAAWLTCISKIQPIFVGNICSQKPLCYCSAQCSETQVPTSSLID